jgi:DNA polymerase/3'-5' exonuclease PolX
VDQNKRESQEAARKKRRRHISSIVSKTTAHHPTNLELSKVFKELGNLHQECPLLPVDMWKAYCFRVVAGRIQNMNFKITLDTLDRLGKIKGIGASSLDKVREYLETGKLSRIKEFRTDSRRIAMKQMMDIWGVGRIKVRPLRKRNDYLDIMCVGKE